MKNFIFLGTHFLELLFLLTIVLFLSGCGGVPVPKNFPVTSSCQIKITNGTSPLVGVVVNLFPDAPFPNIVVEGTTNSSGIALMRTKQGDYSKEGVPNGEYKIRLVEVIDTGLPPLSLDEQMKLTSPQLETRQKEIDSKTDSLRIIPKKLASITTTPLKRTVSGETSLEIDVSTYK
ncbi:MAG: hypothetical protein LBK82_03575 [Planctomycetaceae bacterium]|nr:hypothetical protein [Planctomycetaceae bacterium]